MDYNIELTTMVDKEARIAHFVQFSYVASGYSYSVLLFTSLFQTFDMHNTER